MMPIHSGNQPSPSGHHLDHSYSNEPIKSRQVKDEAVSRIRSDLPRPEYFDVHAAAAYLSVTRKQLEHWRYRGGGPEFSKIGRHVRYRRTDLDCWMTEHRVRNTCEY